jgi:hypothetical protein
VTLREIDGLQVMRKSLADPTDIGDLMFTREGVRIIATVIGAGFLIYAAMTVFRGTLYDVEDGRVDRAARPITFWLLVFGVTILGLFILGVGWQWPILVTIVRLIGHL